MIVKFEKPITIEQARDLYNDTVKFLTTVESYPSITSVEFEESDHQHIFKKEAIDPKVTKQANKIIDKYTKRIDVDWVWAFTEIRTILKGPRKQESIKISKDQRRRVLKVVDSLKNSISNEASLRFKDGFKLGKLRGQILSRQEVDPELTESDEKSIERRLDNNEQYLAAFSKDLKNDLDRIMLEDYESFEELEEALLKEEKVRKSRAFMYPLAVLGLITAGTILTIKRADESKGELRLEGGYWTLHPEEGLLGEICEGCTENEGNWYKLDDFLDEYQTNNCLTNCRCDLKFRGTKIAP